VTDYTWDYRNRLTEVTSKNSAGQITQQVQYAYDYQNRLVSEVVNPGTADQQKTVYVYDANQIVLEFDGTADATSSDPPLSAASLTHRYLWAQAADQLLADEQVSSLTQPGNVLGALTDNLGTVRDLAQYNPTTQTTSIVNHQVFSAFGQLESQTNLSNPQAAAVDCLFGYTGQLFDTATGLQNNLDRWYDPATGTWLSQDPKGFAAGDANLQRYVGNGATYQTDPTGLDGTSDLPPGYPGPGYVYAWGQWRPSTWNPTTSGYNTYGPGATNQTNVCPTPPAVPPAVGPYAKNTSSGYTLSGQAGIMDVNCGGQTSFAGGGANVQVGVASGSLGLTGVSASVAGEKQAATGYLGTTNYNVGLAQTSSLFSAEGSAGVANGSLQAGGSASLVDMTGTAYATIFGIPVGIEATVRVGVAAKVSVGKRTGGQLPLVGIAIVVGNETTPVTEIPAASAPPKKGAAKSGGTRQNQTVFRM
jgi:RHS repeat-associated protein